MNDEDYFLRVECDNDGETVAIVGNKEGLEYLRDRINSLLNHKGPLPEDISLMYPSWGGKGLTEEKDASTSPNCTRVGHLRLYRWE